LHEQLVGIVQVSNGKRGAWRNKWGFPEARTAAGQQMRLGSTETERKSPAVLGRLALAVGVGFFAGWSREILPSSPSSTLIMTVSR
jgi:hypothetical protein